MKQRSCTVYRFLVITLLLWLIISLVDLNSKEFMPFSLPARGSLVVSFWMACMMGSVITLLYGLLETTKNIPLRYLRGLLVALLLQVPYLFLGTLASNIAMEGLSYDVIMSLAYILPAAFLLYATAKQLRQIEETAS